jgi:hypothetical protein
LELSIFCFNKFVLIIIIKKDLSNFISALKQGQKQLNNNAMKF